MKLYDYQQEAIEKIQEFFSISDNVSGCVVIPTGGGKTIVIAELLRIICEQNFNENFAKTGGYKLTIKTLILAHVKELVEQNYTKAINYCTGLKKYAGIVSASLKRKDYNANIIFANIQSIHKNIEILGNIDFILVDECHRIPLKNLNGQYRTLLNKAKKTNPNLKLLGLSATPFRLEKGLIYGNEETVFQKKIYEVQVDELIEKKFLSKPINFQSNKIADISNVGTSTGDFINSQLEKTVNIDELIENQIQEIQKEAKDRKKWIIFGAGIEHCENIKNHLDQVGITSEILHSKKNDRDEVIENFKNFKIRALININILTEGFDDPTIDCVVMLRPTKSPSLYSQMVGRGLRRDPKKGEDQTVLVLDFAGNITRHGAINKLYINEKTINREKGEMPLKFCKKCKEPCFISLKECPHCGEPFDVGNALLESSTQHSEKKVDIIAYKKPPQKLEVENIDYSIHFKRFKKTLPSLRVDYYMKHYCDQFYNQTISEWVALESENQWAAKKAKKWIQQRIIDENESSNLLQINTVEELLQQNLKEKLRTPNYLYVDFNEKYPIIQQYEFV